MKKKPETWVIFFALIATFVVFPLALSADTSAPSTTTKLIFVHHSTGGNWLSDPTGDNPYGGLGIALRDNNYFVSATNYGWGPYGVGDRTDIPNWPEWFTGGNSATILAALYSETGQNFDSFGNWSRLGTDPGGENEIIMFKSCFPNSNLGGNPDDPANAIPNDYEYSVSNAKAVYNDILTYFATRTDKLIVAITAPPLVEGDTSESQAANARGFNNWLVEDWLDGYAHENVVVFDYFNVLTDPANHHRVVSGAVEHVIGGGDNYAYYPSGDSHPNTTGHQKAAAEFVPLLNYYCNQWKASGPSVSKPTVSTAAADAVNAAGAVLNGSVNPNGAATNYFFDYGETVAYGSSTGSKSAGSGTSAAEVSETLSGLDPETTYHFRLAATNSEGTSNGEDRTFATLSATGVLGNIDASPDGLVDLDDAELALEVVVGKPVTTVDLSVETNGDQKIGIAEAANALREASLSAGSGELVQPSDFQYLGAFRLPGGEDPPQTFAYGGNAMTFNPDGDPGNSDAHGGSLFITGHDRLAYGGLPDGDQIAEIAIPVPAIKEDPAELPVATFLQNFQDATAGFFTSMEEIPKVGMQYLNHTDTGAKIHMSWGQHLQPENQASHAWLNATLDTPNMQGTWFIGNQNLYSVNGYMFDIPADWADAHAGGRPLATGRMRDGGQGGMGPTLFAYRPWLAGGAPPASGTRLEEVVLLLYENSYTTTEIIRCVNGYQHADEWEGGAWIVSPSEKTAVLFTGTKSNGTKYWYGYIHPDGPELPCVDAAVHDFETCRMADGSACPESDKTGCCSEVDETCVTYRGWWSTRFDAQFILYDPADLAEVADGTLESWEPQPYASVDIDEHLYLNPPVWDQVNLGWGPQRRYRIGAAAYDRTGGYLYVLEQYADGGKPVVHVWRIP